MGQHDGKTRAGFETKLIDDSAETFEADPIKAKAHLDSIIPRAKINELAKQRSDLEGFKQSAFHTGCVFGSAYLIYYTDEDYAARFLLAFVVSFFFQALHELVHKTAFRTKLFNTFGGNIVGLLTMRPPWEYWYYHWAHHRYTGDPERDSELSGTFLDFEITNIVAYFWYLSGIPMWIDRTTTLINHALGITSQQFLSSNYSAFQVVWEARLFFLFYCGVGYGCHLRPDIGHYVWVYWVQPSLLGQPILRAYVLGEHHGCHNTENIFHNSRTTDTWWIVKKLAWYMPYHQEHHAWTSIPFHKLYEIHELLKDKNIVSKCEPGGEGGYIAINWSFFKTLYPVKGWL